jgi:hypothetical protein
MRSVAMIEKREIDKLEHLLRQTSIWLHAPPLPEAQRRAALLKKLIDKNPEI